MFDEFAQTFDPSQTESRNGMFFMIKMSLLEKHGSTTIAIELDYTSHTQISKLYCLKVIILILIMKNMPFRVAVCGKSKVCANLSNMCCKNEFNENHDLPSCTTTLHMLTVHHVLGSLSFGPFYHDSKHVCEYQHLLVNLD